MRSSVMLCAVALVATGCAPGNSTPKTDPAAEEGAIRALDDQWNAAIAKKDVEANVAFYAPDGAAMWPDAPAAKGTQAIRAAWTEMLKTPNLQIRLMPEDIKISEAGDPRLTSAAPRSRWTPLRGTPRNA